MIARIVVLAIAAALPLVAHADRARGLPSDAPASWRNECASCHVAYPPSLLAASDWRTVMATLGRHYGTDASVDAAVGREIGAFLERNAGTRRVAVSNATEPRITASSWFVREHRKVGDATFARPSIKSAANCGACHPRADVGDFDEHSIRIPR